MKKYIVFVLLLGLTCNLNARNFVKNENIYVKVDQTDAVGDWSKDGAKLFLYLWDGSGDKWLTLSPITSGSKIYRATFDANGNYNKILIIRKSSSGTSGDWKDRWNQTCDLSIPSAINCNIITEFAAKNNVSDACTGTSTWKTYTPAVSTIPNVNTIKSSGVTEEVIHVCPDAATDPFSLRVKLNAAKTAYLYDDVSGHGWFYSADGSTWSSVDSYAGNIRDEEKDKDYLKNKFPASLPTAFYYYLYSNIPSGRRLIKIIPDAVCELDCSITSFETAISAVNADDNTYTLDGMVAFAEPNGKLVIECDGKSVTINSPRSPQSFSLNKVPAATVGGTTTTAKAYFTSNTACTKTITINVPDATQAVETVTKDTLAGASITLSPVGADSKNDYFWLAGKDTVKGAAQNYQLPVYNKDTQIVYIYKEFYPISGTMDDMMSNGNYEDKTFNYGKYGQKSNISDYNYWGIHQQTNPDQDIHFYDTCSLRAKPQDPLHNGFAVVRNANMFHSTFAKIKAREGNNFALFDAATGTAGGNKRAWYATTATNPALKLKKGTTYVLSFWAANLNNFGEMENAARFKFRIQYNGKTKESAVLDLGSTKFRNNLWHQHSETFYADEDCDNVTISVVNLNTNVLDIGNDFALDDIQFHAISSISKVVKSQQKFIVTFHETKIDAFTATVLPVACDSDYYTIAMHVDYKNPNGQLIIKDLTTGTEYPYDVTAPYDTPSSLDKTITISTKEPTHNWEVYFAGWPTAKKTATTVIPGFPAIEANNFTLTTPTCSDLTTTLTFDLDYTYQQGTLTYWVDGQTAQTGTYSVADKTKQTLAGLTVADIPADGLATHKLHISFDGPNSCIKEFTLPAVPFSPVINNVSVSGVPAQVDCNADDYTITVTITTPYNATGHNIVLTYDDKGAKTTTIPATGTTTTTTVTMHNPGATPLTITAAFETTPACTKTSDAFTPPVRFACNVYIETICEGESYTKHGFNIITPPVGVDTFALGYDSLILTVQTLPAIHTTNSSVVCDDENTILLPFTPDTGTPDSFVVRINNTDYDATVSGTDLVFARPTNLPPGDYNATVITGRKGSACTTAQDFTIRISDSHLMYRKWEDVLFIDNSSKRFVKYQWFENGALIPGKTEQQLYNPEGLTGTYFCRVTTDDGSVFYTCESAFDDVPRSRDAVNDKQPAETVRKVLRQGQLIIIREEKEYNLLGGRVK